MSTNEPVRQRTAASGIEAGGYRLIYAASFVVFLVVAAIARLFAWRWHPWPPGPGGYTSVIHEAKVAAGTVAVFAFMG